MTVEGNRILAPRAELGMAAMTAAMCVVPCMDAIAKHLSHAMSPAEIACLRFLFQTAFLVPCAVLGGRSLRTPHLGLHMARGVLIGMALLPLIWSLQTLPLANAIAIFFVEPLILTLMSFVLLGERFGPRRLAAVVVGLVGAMIVIRPAWSEFGAASLLPLVTAVMFAGYLALTRRSATEEDPITLQLWAGVFATLFLGVMLLIGGWTGTEVLAPSWPSTAGWWWLLAMGGISALGHGLIGFAFSQAPASLLAPFQYLEIVSATALGYLVFGNFPDSLTLLGTAVIVGAGLYVYMREREIARSGA